jgi:uncharacterized membrane protein
MFELPTSIPRKIGLLLLAFFFVFAGVMHFVNAAFFVAIMPPYLPWHLELVYLSGVFEIALGLAVLPVATRSRAGFGLIALLVAVYPANIHMAVNPDAYVEAGASLVFIYGRLPFQFLFMYWAWWATRSEAEAS